MLHISKLLRSQGYTPLNTKLIPTNATSNTTKLGTFSGQSITNTADHVIGVVAETTALQTDGYRVFLPNNTGYVFDCGTGTAWDVWFTLATSAYGSGYFTPGTYRWTTTIGCSNYSNAQMIYRLWALTPTGWSVVGYVDNGYPNTPFTSTCTFTINVPFRGIKMQKCNPTNYSHGRNCYRYNSNLVKIA